MLFKSQSYKDVKQQVFTFEKFKKRKCLAFLVTQSMKLLRITMLLGWSSSVLQTSVSQQLHRWIVIKFCSDIRGAQRRNTNDCGDPSSSIRIFSFLQIRSKFEFIHYFNLRQNTQNNCHFPSASTVLCVQSHSVAVETRACCLGNGSSCNSLFIQPSFLLFSLWHHDTSSGDILTWRLHLLTPAFIPYMAHAKFTLTLSTYFVQKELFEITARVITDAFMCRMDVKTANTIVLQDMTLYLSPTLKQFQSDTIWSFLLN